MAVSAPQRQRTRQRPEYARCQSVPPELLGEGAGGGAAAAAKSHFTARLPSLPSSSSSFRRRRSRKRLKEGGALASFVGVTANNPALATPKCYAAATAQASNPSLFSRADNGDGAGGGAGQEQQQQQPAEASSATSAPKAIPAAAGNAAAVAAEDSGEGGDGGTSATKQQHPAHGMSPESDVATGAAAESSSPKAHSFTSSWADRAKFPPRPSVVPGGVGAMSGAGGFHVGGGAAFDLLEYPFITLRKFPPGFLHRIGGLVSCRSVKLLEGLEEETETRDSWWLEIRQEIRAHARCLGCNVVVGYSEDTVIWEDVVVLCASGTAAIGDLHQMLDLDSAGSMFGPPFINSALNNNPQQQQQMQQQDQHHHHQQDCGTVHIPYAEYSLPYSCKTSRCGVCKRGRVSDVLFSTVEPPEHLDVVGRGCLLQAKVLRLKKDLKGEHNAKEISDALPFIEYEVHRQLINKLKIKGMNALFGLRLNVSIGDRTIIGTATATACFLAALPPPTRPRLLCSPAWQSDPTYLKRTQQRLEDRIRENLEQYGIQRTRKASSEDDGGEAANGNGADHDQADLDDDPVETEADFAAGNKDTCVLEIDDAEDVDILDSLMDPFPPPQLQVFSTESLIGIPPGLVVKCCQTFSQVWRGRIQPSSRDLSSSCQRALSAIYFKLRRLRPCVLARLSFNAELDEENELQLCVYGTAISLSGTRGVEKVKNGEEANGNGDAATSSEEGHKSPALPQRQFYMDEIGGPGTFPIHLTPLSYIPGASIDKYLGNLNLFLIRETSSLREAGGLNSFIQAFISEVFSIVRSHVCALGGNALVGYFMSEFVVSHSPHKNQGQCLIHVGGDVVKVAYVES